MKKIYLTFHNNFLDKIIVNKRKEILNLIIKETKYLKIRDVLDIGTTEDDNFESSNYIIRNLKKIKIKKSLTNQKIKNSFFDKYLKKSILKNFTKNEINKFKSDLVISNATIEHVGSKKNQIQMIKNIVRLTKKTFIISTPNRYYPIDFHTKIPFAHWFPKKIHRYILNILGFEFYSKEKNLNLISKKDLENIMKEINFYKYKIYTIKFFLFSSNLILIGKKSKNNI